MKEILVIKGDKEQSKVLRWLKLGASKDDARPALTGIKIDGDAAITADGFRMHMAPTPPCVIDHDGKILAGKVPSGDFLTELETVESIFPDYRQIIPDSELVKFEITVNSKYLVDAVKGMGADCDNRCVLQFYGPHQPMVIIDPSKHNPKKAVIMPMHAREGAEYWDPRDAEA